MSDTHHLNNPMRFSVKDRVIDLSDYPVEATKIDVCASSADIFVHWEEEDQ